MGDLAKNLILWGVIAVVLLTLFNNFMGKKEAVSVITYSQFITDVKEGRVQSVIFEADDKTINGYYASNEKFTTFNPGDPDLVNDLLVSDVEIRTKPEEKPVFATRDTDQLVPNAVTDRFMDLLYATDAGGRWRTRRDVIW